MYSIMILIGTVVSAAFSPIKEDSLTMSLEIIIPFGSPIFSPQSSLEFKILAFFCIS